MNYHSIYLSFFICLAVWYANLNAKTHNELFELHEYEYQNQTRSSYTNDLPSSEVFNPDINLPYRISNPCKAFQINDMVKRKDCTTFNEYVKYKSDRTMIKNICGEDRFLKLVTKNLTDTSRSSYLNNMECIFDYIKEKHKMFDDEKIFYICKYRLRGELITFNVQSCRRNLCLADGYKNYTCITSECNKYSLREDRVYDRMYSFSHLTAEYDFTHLCYSNSTSSSIRSTSRRKYLANYEFGSGMGYDQESDESLYEDITNESEELEKVYIGNNADVASANNICTWLITLVTSIFIFVIIN